MALPNILQRLEKLGYRVRILLEWTGLAPLTDHTVGCGDSTTRLGCAHSTKFIFK